jgi:hypothetical protein
MILGRTGIANSLILIFFKGKKRTRASLFCGIVNEPAVL